MRGRVIHGPLRQGEDNGEIKGPPPGQGGQANKGALLKPHSAFIGSTEITPETAWMGVHSNARTH